MNKINYILKDLILESRRKDLLNKYRELYEKDFEKNGGIEIDGGDWDDFNSFVSVVENAIPHPKYLEFALKNMCCDVRWDLPDKILNLLDDFHELSEKGFIKNKDIYSKEYKNDVDFKFLTSVIGEAKKIEREKELKTKLTSERDVVYNGDRWMVIVPKSHLASCKYGAGTKWCTASKNDPGHFDGYTDDALLFYILDKNEIPTTQSMGEVNDNLMYKIAINWRYHFDDGENKYVGYSILDRGEVEMYDIKDNRIKISHIIPLLPKDMVDSMEDYYRQIIQSKNKEKQKKDLALKLILNDFQQKLVDSGLVSKFMSKLERDLPKEQVVRLNGGIDELETDSSTHTFWLTLNEYTSMEHDLDGGIPIYSGFVLGTQEMTGKEQFLEIMLTDEEGVNLEAYELVMDPNGFGDIFGSKFVRGINPSSPNWERWLNFLNKKKDEFFNTRPEIIINKLYNKVVNFIRDNSWTREWRGENAGKTYHTTSDGEVYWVPSNCSSTYVFKYPLKEGSITHNFIKYIKENPGSTSKQFYNDVYQQKYYPGLNTALTPSLRDAGIVKTKKGTYGELKYYLGPNYKKWTQGRVHRYRLQCIPMKWKSRR
jgi:hypothetical protein